MGGATLETGDSVETVKVQSTLPVGGATRKKGQEIYINRISIHAPRGGSDGWEVYTG